VNMKLVNSELTGKILGCAFSVYNDVGPFLDERAYQIAMEYALSDAGLEWEHQVPFPVYFRGRQVALGKADLVVEDQVILELKAADALHPKFEAQLIAYLASSGKEVGFLLNFGHVGKLEFRRLILTADYRAKSRLNPCYPCNP